MENVLWGESLHMLWAGPDPTPVRRSPECDAPVSQPVHGRSQVRPRDPYRQKRHGRGFNSAPAAKFGGFSLACRVHNALTMRLRHLLYPILVLLVACTATTDSTPDPESAGKPPVWEDAPTMAVTVGEGQTITIPLSASDPDGGEVTVTATAPPGIDATVIEGELSLHANYGAASAPMTVLMTDEHGDATPTEISVQVAPIGWVDYRTWTMAEGPEEREHATVLFHEETGQAFVFGGSGYYPQFVQMLDDFWRYDIASGAWSRITPTGDIPPARGSQRFAGAWGSGQGMLFGGYGANNISSNDVYSVAVENGTLRFELLEPVAEKPFARALHAFVYDAVSDRYFTFGGTAGFIYGDTWMMEVVDGKAKWTELMMPGGAPTPRYGFFYGFDEVAGRMLLFSGAQAGGADILPAADIWALDVRSDPPAWIWLTDQGPEGRRNGCAIWDPSGPRLVVFGGTPDAMTSSPGLHLFDARPGFESWTTLPLANEPDVRSSGFGFFDGNRVYLGFGNGDNGLYRDWGILGY